MKHIKQQDTVWPKHLGQTFSEDLGNTETAIHKYLHAKFTS